MAQPLALRAEALYACLPFTMATSTICVACGHSICAITRAQAITLRTAAPSWRSLACLAFTLTGRVPLQPG
ncbi:hypothetical protein D3C81_1430260 [compost metagenome]